VNYGHRCPKGKPADVARPQSGSERGVKAKGTIFAIVYRRLVPRLGHAQAICAIAHRLSRLVWKILHQGIRYDERGPAVSHTSKQVRASEMIRQLQNLGLNFPPNTLIALRGTPSLPVVAALPVTADVPTNHTLNTANVGGSDLRIDPVENVFVSTNLDFGYCNVLRGLRRSRQAVHYLHWGFPALDKVSARCAVAWPAWSRSASRRQRLQLTDAAARLTALLLWRV
jgi:hypothetical protein